MPNLTDIIVPSGSITAAKIADNAISTAKITDNNLDWGKVSSSANLSSIAVKFPAYKLINIQDCYDFQEASPCSESYNGGAYSNTWNTVRSFSYTPKRSDTRVHFVSTMAFYHSGSSWGATIHRSRVLNGAGSEIFYQEWTKGSYNGSYGNTHNDSIAEWTVNSWGTTSQTFNFQWNPHPGNANNIIYYHNIRAYEFMDDGFTKGRYDNGTYPHDGVYIQTNTVRANASGGVGSAASDGTWDSASGFAWHAGHAGVSAFPAYCAIYFGDAYPTGVALNHLRLSLHGNSFGDFQFQGSNDSGKASGFYNNGTWTTLLSANGYGYASNVNDKAKVDFPFFNDTRYKAYRIRINNIVNRDGTASGGTYGGWACYGWQLNRV